MKKIMGLTIAVGVLISSCNMPATGTPDPQIATAAALTVQAVLTPLNSPTAPAQVPLSTSMTSTQTGTPAATKTATATITPTYSIPMLTIKESTNCRSGPGQSYEIIFAFLPGASTEIVGQYPTDNYWVVKLPDSNDTCWVWGQYATVSGSYWVVPTATPPPTATVSAPEAPTGLNLAFECNFNGVNADITVNLKWSDNSNGEEGFRVIRDGNVVAQLPPNSTTYTDIFAANVTDKFSYSIVVFSGNLTAQSSTTNLYSCQ